MTTIDEILELAKSAPQPKRDGRVMNAYRHGLTGHVRFTTPADEQAYKTHCVGYLESWSPRGAVEIDLCQSLADDRWRLKRAAQIENALMALTVGSPDKTHCDVEDAAIALAHARVWLERGKELNLLTTYERRIQRNFKENLATLQQLQAIRHKQEEAALHAAAVAEVEARMHPRPVRREPKFVFSTRPKHPKVPVYSPPPAEKLAA